MRSETDSSQYVEYAPKGLVGVLTPQANTTVEPEFAILSQPGFAFINARLVSDKATIEDRLIDYIESIDHQRRQFANAPLNSLALATTGVSYLVGAQREDTLIQRVLEDDGIALVTSATAVCDALNVMRAGTIALLSPYPPSLTEQSRLYWISRGFNVIDVVHAYTESTEFHPIYAMPAERTNRLLDGMQDCRADAIVMLGTGMPTLAAIASHADWDGPPVLSCVLALAWRCVLAAASQKPLQSDLKQWLSAKDWANRLPVN